MSGPRQLQRYWRKAQRDGLVDWSPRKKLLLIAPTVAIALGCFPTVFVYARAPQFVIQCVIGAAAAFFAPTIAAASLGIVGKRNLSGRIGRNQGFASSGNVIAAVSAGLLGTFIGENWIFYFSAIMSIAAIAATGLIRDSDIDYGAARAAASTKKIASLKELLRDPRLITFTASVMLFHLANAAMLPLVGENLTRLSHASSPIAGCVTLGSS